MFSDSWWQQLLSKLRDTWGRRKATNRSTRPMIIEVLEDRMVPATIFVHNTADGTQTAALTAIGPGTFTAPSLRSAVFHANAIAGNNTILLDPNATYSLHTAYGGELVIQLGTQKTLAITTRNGNITNDATIDANNESRVFEIFGSSKGTLATLDHLNIVDGNGYGGVVGNGIRPLISTGGNLGGGIANHGNLNLTFDYIHNNHSTGNSYGGNAFGGGIYSDGPSLIISYSHVQENVAQGGPSSGSTINEFAGSAWGGGLYLAGAEGATSARIYASTFDQNQAIGGDYNQSSPEDGEGFGGSAFGGAVATGNSSNLSLRIINSTFASTFGGGEGGNAAFGGNFNAYGGFNAYGSGGFAGDAYGGAIFTGTGNSVYLVNDTVAFNLAFGGFNGNAYGSSGTGYGGGVANFGDLFQTPAVKPHVTGLPAPLTGSVNVINTIIADNNADQDPDVFGVFNSLGHNLIGDPTGSTGFLTTGVGALDRTGNPGFASSDLSFNKDLNKNQPPTQTLGLNAFSQALDAGDNRVATNAAVAASLGIVPLTTDQRGPGYKRIVNVTASSTPTIDIGAFEFQMNLNKFYSFTSNATSSSTFTVGGFNSSPPTQSATNPKTGLLVGAYNYAPFIETEFQNYQVKPQPAFHPTPGTTLEIFADGGFTFTVPPKFQGTITVPFQIDLNDDGDISTTRLAFFLTIQVGPAGIGRGSAGAFLGR